MKPQLTDEKIVKAEDTLRSWAKGMISGKYTRDWKFRYGTKTLIIGYRNIRQFLMLINDLIYYKSKFEELQKALERIAKMEEIDGGATDEMIIARQALQSIQGDNT